MGDVICIGGGQGHESPWCPLREQGQPLDSQSLDLGVLCIALVERSVAAPQAMWNVYPFRLAARPSSSGRPLVSCAASSLWQKTLRIVVGGSFVHGDPVQLPSGLGISAKLDSVSPPITGGRCRRGCLARFCPANYPVPERRVKAAKTGEHESTVFNG